MVWTQRLDYSAHTVEAAVELFRLLRRSTYQLIRTLPERVWAQTAHHPENGWMTLDDWLTVYERHVRDHVAQMRLGQTAWERAGRPA